MKPEARRTYEAIGERIATVRRMRGMRQEDLAKCVRLTRTSVCNIEAGRQAMLIDTLLVFARALGVQVSVLLGNERGKRRKE